MVASRKMRRSTTRGYLYLLSQKSVPICEGGKFEEVKGVSPSHMQAEILNRVPNIYLQGLEGDAIPMASQWRSSKIIEVLHSIAIQGSHAVGADILDLSPLGF